MCPLIANPQAYVGHHPRDKSIKVIIHIDHWPKNILAAVGARGYPRTSPVVPARCGEIVGEPVTLDLNTQAIAKPVTNSCIICCTNAGRKIPIGRRHHGAPRSIASEIIDVRVALDVEPPHHTDIWACHWLCRRLRLCCEWKHQYRRRQKCFPNHHSVSSPYRSPHFAMANAAPNVAAVDTASLNFRMRGKSLCFGMFGIKS